jgi:hypothetical protein
MVVHQFIRQRLDLLCRQIQRWRRLIDLDDLKLVDVHHFPAFLLQGSIPQKVTL